MSYNITLRTFRGVAKDQFNRAVEKVVTDSGGTVEWGKAEGGLKAFATCGHGDVQTIVLEWELDESDYLLSCALGRLLKCPWMELRVQRESHWDYTLYVGSEFADQFSTWPEFWHYGPEFEAASRGDPMKLAEIWGVPVTQLTRYFVPWTTERASDGEFTHAKAYEGDEYGYGDHLQMFDFLRALGGENPIWSSSPETVAREVHGLRYPPIEILNKKAKEG